MSILDSAEALYQQYSGSGDWLDKNNSHDAQFGTGTPGTNDPLFKDFIGTQFLFLPDASFNNISTPDASVLEPADEIDLRIRVRLSTFTDGNQHLITKDDIAAQRSYYLRIENSGGLHVRIYGGVEFRSSSTLQSAISAGDLAWIRITIDYDNGDTNSEGKFYWSLDDTNDSSQVTWTQLGSTQTAAVATVVETSAILDVSAHGNDIDDGDLYVVQVLDAIDGTLAFDAHLSDATESGTTFTERSVNAATVTINRGSSGLVSTIINRPWMLLSTDDYFEIADDAALDFATGDDFTAMVMFRPYTVASGEDVLLAKKDDLTTSAGYALLRSTANGKGLIGDSSADDDDTVATVAIHTTHTVAMVRDAAGDNDIEAFLDGVASGSATTDSTTLTLANALPLRIGATSNTAASFFEGVIGAVAIWDSALTPDQVAEAHARLTQLPAFPPFHRRQYPLVRM